MEVSTINRPGSKDEGTSAQKPPSPTTDRRMSMLKSESSYTKPSRDMNSEPDKDTEASELLLSSLRNQINDLYERLEATEEHCRTLQTQQQQALLDQLTARILTAYSAKETQSRSTSPPPIVGTFVNSDETDKRPSATPTPDMHPDQPNNNMESEEPSRDEEMQSVHDALAESEAKRVELEWALQQANKTIAAWEVWFKSAPIPFNSPPFMLTERATEVVNIAHTSLSVAATGSAGRVEDCVLKVEEIWAFADNNQAEEDFIAASTIELSVAESIQSAEDRIVGQADEVFIEEPIQDDILDGQRDQDEVFEERPSQIKSSPAQTQQVLEPQREELSVEVYEISDDSDSEQRASTPVTENTEKTPAAVYDMITPKPDPSRLSWAEYRRSLPNVVVEIPTVKKHRGWSKGSSRSRSTSTVDESIVKSETSATGSHMDAMKTIKKSRLSSTAIASIFSEDSDDEYTENEEHQIGNARRASTEESHDGIKREGDSYIDMSRDVVPMTPPTERSASFDYGSPTPPPLDEISPLQSPPEYPSPQLQSQMPVLEQDPSQTPLLEPNPSSESTVELDASSQMPTLELAISQSPSHEQAISQYSGPDIPSRLPSPEIQSLSLSPEHPPSPELPPSPEPLPRSMTPEQPSRSLSEERQDTSSPHQLSDEMTYAAREGGRNRGYRFMDDDSNIPAVSEIPMKKVTNVEVNRNTGIDVGSWERWDDDQEPLLLDAMPSLEEVAELNVGNVQPRGVDQESSFEGQEEDVAEAMGDTQDVTETMEDTQDVTMKSGKKRKRKLRAKNAVFAEEMAETLGTPPPQPKPARGRKKGTTGRR